MRPWIPRGIRLAKESALHLDKPLIGKDKRLNGDIPPRGRTLEPPEPPATITSQGSRRHFTCCVARGHMSRPLGRGSLRGAYVFWPVSDV